jgi:hypothetical protein
VKRRAGAFTFSANYSYALSKANYLDTENAYDVLSHWSNDGLTRRHYAVGSVVYALPFGHGKQFLSTSNGIAERAVSGWSTNLITYLASGSYFSPSFSGSDPSHTNTSGGLPDLVGNPNAVPGGKSKTNWFNVNAFAVPQVGHFGNALPFSLESQNLYMTHLSIIKETRITDRVKFQFVAQMSNLFNHPQFVAPGGSITVAGGNQFTAQSGTFNSLEVAKPRQISFQGGFTF